MHPQGIKIQDAWGWCTGMTQKDGTGKEEGGGSGLGTHVYPWRIHVDVWQNQYNIVIILQLKFKKLYNLPKLCFPIES